MSEITIYLNYLDKFESPDFGENKILIDFWKKFRIIADRFLSQIHCHNNDMFDFCYEYIYHIITSSDNDKWNRIMNCNNLYLSLIQEIDIDHFSYKSGKLSILKEFLVKQEDHICCATDNYNF